MRVFVCLFSIEIQTLQGAPYLVGVGHLFEPQLQKDLGSMSFWSHGHSRWRIAYKIKIVVFVTYSYLMRLDTPYPDPRGPKRGPGASAVHLAETLLKKVAGYPNLVGVGHLFGPQIRKNLVPVWMSHGA